MHVRSVLPTGIDRLSLGGYGNPASHVCEEHRQQRRSLGIEQGETRQEIDLELFV